MIAASCFCEPTKKAIPQEKKNTTMVRTAVARVESVWRMPHFAKMAVIPAKNAEPNEKKIHINASSLVLIFREWVFLLGMWFFAGAERLISARGQERGYRLRH